MEGLALNRRVTFPSVVEGRKMQVWEEVGRVRAGAVMPYDLK